MSQDRSQEFVLPCCPGLGLRDLLFPQSLSCSLDQPTASSSKGLLRCSETQTLWLGTGGGCPPHSSSKPFLWKSASLESDSGDGDEVARKMGPISNPYFGSGIKAVNLKPDGC